MSLNLFHFGVNILFFIREKVCALLLQNLDFQILISLDSSAILLLIIFIG